MTAFAVCETCGATFERKRATRLAPRFCKPCKALRTSERMAKYYQANREKIIAAVIARRKAK